jgi:pilus assembly protein FimV
LGLTGGTLVLWHQSAASEAQPAGDESAENDFDLDDLDLAEEPTDSLEQGSASSTASSEAESASTAESGEPEFDLDALGDLEGSEPDADVSDLDSEFLGSGDTEAAPARGSGEESALEFDLPGVDSEAESVSEGTQSPAAQASAEPADADVSSEEEEFDTMLDLAKAYIDMGDAESAGNALEEVIESGNEAQRREAEKLLETVQ